MGRWEPNARERLEKAALELFGERGFDQSTAAEIAARAGLAERTFFRHFADKREVLFGGASQLQESFERWVADAPDSAAPIEAVAGAVEAAGTFFAGDRREFAQMRQRVISANAELQERELIKFATLSMALADVLRGRGVAEPAASLAAEAGVTLFKITFQRWIDPSNHRDFGALVRDSLAELRSVTAGR